MFDGSFARDVIADFGSCFTVTRRKSASLVHGIARPAAGAHAAETFSIDAVVQPAGRAALQRLPDGRREIETRQVLTTTPLQLGGQGAGHEADLIEIEGEQWEVQAVAEWPAYFDALAQKPAQ